MCLVPRQALVPHCAIAFVGALSRLGGGGGGNVAEQKWAVSPSLPIQHNAGSNRQNRRDSFLSWNFSSFSALDIVGHWRTSFARDKIDHWPEKIMDVWGFFAGTRQNPPQKHLIFILIISNTNFYCHILQKYCSEEYERTQKSFLSGSAPPELPIEGLGTELCCSNISSARTAWDFYDEGDIPSEKC